VTENLWEFLSTSEVDVASLMNNWTKEMGYPVVEVSRTGSNSFHLLQRRFLLTGLPTPEQDQVVWSIPLLIRVASSNEPARILMTEKEMDITLENCTENDWVKFNTEYSGFYIVKYDDSMTQALSENIEQLASLDRFSLVKDYSLMMQSSESAAEFLKLIQGLQNETDYCVWDTIITGLGSIRHILETEQDVLEKFNEFVIELMVPTFERLGWVEQEDDEYEVKLLRPLIIHTLGKAEYQPVVQEAQRQFKAFLTDNVNIAPNLRSAIYALGASNGDEEDWNNLFDYYTKTEVLDDKNRALRNLCGFKQPELIRKALGLATSEYVRLQDLCYVPANCGRNEFGTAITWEEFVQPRWDEIYELTSGGSTMTWIVHAVRSFVDEGRAVEIEEFFQSVNTKGVERAVEQVLETVRKNIAWKTRDLTGISEFLLNY